MIVSHFSGVMSSTASNDSMPALVTRISTGPRSARTRANAASTDPRSATSTSTASAVPPLARSSAGGPRRGRAVAVDDRDPVAVGDELLRGAETDAGRTAGDDRDAAHRLASTGSNSRCSFVRPRRIHVGS